MWNGEDDAGSLGRVFVILDLTFLIAALCSLRAALCAARLLAAEAVPSARALIDLAGIRSQLACSRRRFCEPSGRVRASAFTRDLTDEVTSELLEDLARTFGGSTMAVLFVKALGKLISMWVPVLFVSIVAMPGGTFSFPPPEPATSLEKETLWSEREEVLRGPRFGGAASDFRGTFFSFLSAETRLVVSSSDTVTRSSPISGDDSRALRGSCMDCPGWIVRYVVSSEGT